MYKITKLTNKKDKVVFYFANQAYILINNVINIYNVPGDLHNIFNKVNFDTIYIITGPGYYTGTRKAIALAKGLNKKLFGVCIIKDIMYKKYGPSMLIEGRLCYYWYNNTIKLDIYDNVKSLNIYQFTINDDIIHDIYNYIFDNSNQFLNPIHLHYFDSLIW